VTNISKVVAWLDQFVDGFDFTRPGKGQSLGRDVKSKAVQLIHDSSLIDRTGFGTAWQPNSEAPTKWHPQGYRRWKEENYGTDEPNSRTGQMLSKELLWGRTKNEAKQVTLTYDTDKPPSRATFGSPDPKLLARDQKVTDTFKAYLAHTGQSRKQIVRPFYQLIDEDGIAIADLCQENLNQYIRDTNAGNGY
jgi:hypothetical protein